MNFDEIINNARCSIEHNDLKVAIPFIASHQPKVVVEVGMWKGYSAELFIKAFDPDFLITMERDHKHEDGFYINDPRYNYLWDTDSGSEATMKKVISLLDGRLIDFLFIDGGHLYSEVGKDIRNYAGLVKEGGIIAFHDILYFSDACQVNPYWEKLKKEYDYVEINCGEGSTGFGIVIKTPRTHKPINELHI